MNRIETIEILSQHPPLHAKGSVAYGTLTITHDVTRCTKAKLFSQIGRKTDLFLRFSTVASERDAVRGVAIECYTEEGHWDLVGNNTPVFFICGPAYAEGASKALAARKGC